MPAPCNRCEVPVSAWDSLASGDVRCGLCGAPGTVRIFPAFWKGAGGPEAGETAGEGEATCYDHPAKRAAAACARCGRFVCQLCAVDFKGAVWCPTCVMAPAAELESSRTLYDSMALLLALAPLLIWPLTILTAPAAMYTAIRYWKQPLSVVRRRRWRFVLAILVSGLELAGWAGVAAFVAATGGKVV